MTPEVKSYLSAVNAAAIYITVLQQTPKSVGVARDLDRTLVHLRRLMNCRVTFGWIAWAQDFDALVAIAKIPDLMQRKREDGVTVARTLREIIRAIDSCAVSSAIVLTPHKKVVERATVLAGYVEQVFADLRTSGQMAQFNAAYKNYRRSMLGNGAKNVLPYWAATERLKRVTIRALVTSPSRSLSQEKLAELISQEFPWFSGKMLDNSKSRA